MRVLGLPVLCHRGLGAIKGAAGARAGAAKKMAGAPGRLNENATPGGVGEKSVLVRSHTRPRFLTRKLY